MKIIMRRQHTVRPADYESVVLTAQCEIDLDSESDREEYEGLAADEVGKELSQVLDALLDSDVDRTLRLDSKYIEDTHLWVFYEKD